VHLIEDPELLLRGDFSRDGFDLVITGQNGQVTVIADYFSFDPPPNLMLPNGAGFSPELVQSLLHDGFDDALYAGPAGGAAQIAIGKVAFIIGQVIRKGANGEEILQRGDTLYRGDEIEVVGAGRLLARMNDGTTFRLGQDARAVLTEFEYNESAKVGNFEATVIRGGFSYKSGAISKFDNGGNHSTISTPTAIIRIRGSELDGTVSSSGETIVIHKSGILTVTDINGNNPVELTQFIEAIENALGQKAEKEFMDIQPGDVAETYANIDDLYNAVGFKPETSIEEGIGHFIEWYRKYYKAD
jgi:hypothetical protein